MDFRKANSLAMLSSKFLEANNKIVKAVLNRLPGGCSQINVLMHVYRIKKTTRAQYFRNFAQSTDVCEVCGKTSLEPFVPSLSAIKTRKRFLVNLVVTWRCIECAKVVNWALCSSCRPMRRTKTLE
jgi:ribosomal protein L28